MSLEPPRLLGVIGDPIEHSLSPRMHNAALAHLGLPFLYLPFHVTGRELKSFVRNMGRLGLAGINVTIPHKIAIIDLMDRMSDAARRVGAVNTVALVGGRRIGHNTDGEGFLSALRTKTGFNPRGETALLLGAGGAARAIAFALSQAGITRLAIVNRSTGAAERLAADLVNDRPDLKCSTYGLQSRGWRSETEAANLIIQATSLGLSDDHSVPVDFAHSPRGAVVCDLVYRQGLTPFLRRAKAHHLKILEGRSMLLWQGALAFKIWTGHCPPLDVMAAALIKDS